jgi:hypothetical protein
MDQFGGLKTETFRPVLMLMIPGLVVGIPGLFVLQHYQPDMFSFADSHPTLSAFLSVVVSAIFGVLTYEIGTNIEVHWIDKHLEKNDSAFLDDWYRYLRCILPEGSVAHGYIHDRVLYLKFEVGMASALMLCIPIIIWAWVIRGDFKWSWFLGLTFILVVGIRYFLFEAQQSAVGLAKLRKEVLKGVGMPPNCGGA